MGRKWHTLLMRVLHTSDWHLGRFFHGHDLHEIHSAFLDHLIEVVKDQKIDLVVLSGDVFDRAVAPTQSVALADEAFRRLTELTRVVLTAGNHDSDIRLGFNAEQLNERLTIAARIENCGRGYDFPDASGRVGLRVYPLPYLDPDAARVTLPPHLRLLGEQVWAEGEEHPQTWQMLARSHEAAVGAALRLVQADLAAHKPKTPVLVMAHAFVVGGQASQSERDIRVGGVDSVPSALFTQVPGLAYAALGHLHRPQEIAVGDLDSARPPARLVYSGSPVPLSFGEAEFEKSSVIAEFDGAGLVSLERVTVPSFQPIATISGTFEQLMGPDFDDYSEHWLRVRLAGARPPQALAQLKQRFKGLCVFEQTDLPQQIDSPRLNRDNTLSPLQLSQGFMDEMGIELNPYQLQILRSSYEKVVKEAH